MITKLKADNNIGILQSLLSGKKAELNYALKNNPKAVANIKQLEAEIKELEAKIQSTSVIKSSYMEAKRIYSGRSTGSGAGALFYAEDTGKFLLVKRSNSCDYPGTWCGLGGGIEHGESPDEAVRREAREEAQFPEDAPCDLRYIGCQESPDFKFHNFLGVLPCEFTPRLNHEHTEHQWTKWGNFPPEMHPKMMEALNGADGQQVLRQHTNAFDY